MDILTMLILPIHEHKISFHLFVPLWKTVWRFLKKLRIELPYDPAIPLLGIYPENTKTLIWKDTRTPMFITALFTVANIWKQPKCPSTDEWIKRMFYIHTHTHTHTPEYYSAIKKNEILPFTTTWIDLEVIMLSEISQTNTTRFHSYVEYKKRTNKTK